VGCSLSARASAGASEFCVRESRASVRQVATGTVAAHQHHSRRRAHLPPPGRDQQDRPGHGEQAGARIRPEAGGRGVLSVLECGSKRPGDSLPKGSGRPDPSSVLKRIAFRSRRWGRRIGRLKSKARDCPGAPQEGKSPTARGEHVTHDIRLVKGCALEILRDMGAEEVTGQPRHRRRRIVQFVTEARVGHA